MTWDAVRTLGVSVSISEVSSGGDARKTPRKTSDEVVPMSPVLGL
jgi:hypothetical protein